MNDSAGYLTPASGEYKRNPKKFWSEDAGVCIPRSPVGVLAPQVVPPTASANNIHQDELSFFVSARFRMNINDRQQVFPKHMEPEDINALKASEITSNSQGVVIGAGEKDWRATYSYLHTGLGNSVYDTSASLGTDTYGLSVRVPIGDTFVNYSKEVYTLLFTSGEILKGSYNLTEDPFYYYGESGPEKSSSDYVTVRSRVAGRLSVGATVKFADGSIYDRQYIGTAEIGYFSLAGIPFGFGTAVTQKDGKMLYGVDLDIVRIGNLGMTTDGKWTSVVYSFSFGFGG